MSVVANETIGQRIRRLRRERGFSQRELATPGVSYAYISRIEAGQRNPSLSALRELAPKLDVTPLYLEMGETNRCPHCYTAIAGPGHRGHEDVQAI